MTPARAPSTSGLTRQDVFSVLGALGAILTLVTAVMFYFGWRRSEEQARAMSIDVSLFGFSTQDYVLRSIGSLYLPLLGLLGLGVAGLWLHRRTEALLDSGTALGDSRRDTAAVWSRRVAAGAVVLAVLSVVAALLGATGSRAAAVLLRPLTEQQWVVPLVFVVAVGVSVWAGWLHRRLRPPPEGSHPPLWQTSSAVLLVGGMLCLGLFWLMEEYAQVVGARNALALADGVDRLPATTVLSPTPLGIDAPGVQDELVDPETGADGGYRTTGLRLLGRSGGKVLLVHDGWDPRTGTVVVLADSDAYGWQFSRCGADGGECSR
jgi:hypothetical protein